MLGIGKIIGKFVKNSSQRELGRLNSIVQKINAFESEVKKVGNESFPAKTAEFMSKVNKGVPLDDLIENANIYMHLFLKHFARTSPPF